MSESASRDDRRQRALVEARVLLEQSGSSALSMRKLANAAGMAINTLYALFGTRDGVLVALVEDAIARQLAVIEDVDSSGTPIDQLAAMVSASIQHAVTNPSSVKPMHRATRELRSLRRVAISVGIKLFERRISEAISAGQLREDINPELLAEFQMQLINEASLSWALDEISDDEFSARCHYALAVLLVSAAAPACAEVLLRRLQEAGNRLRSLRE